MKTVKEKYTSYGMFGMEIFCKREDEIIDERNSNEGNEIEEIEK